MKLIEVVAPLPSGAVKVYESGGGRAALWMAGAGQRRGTQRPGVVEQSLLAIWAETLARNGSVSSRVKKQPRDAIAQVCK